jgi:hypothetical protein
LRDIESFLLILRQLFKQFDQPVVVCSFSNPFGRVLFGFLGFVVVLFEVMFVNSCALHIAVLLPGDVLLLVCAAANRLCCDIDSARNVAAVNSIVPSIIPAMAFFFNIIIYL